jgi:hypothetical protein
MKKVSTEGHGSRRVRRQPLVADEGPVSALEVEDPEVVVQVERDVMARNARIVDDDRRIGAAPDPDEGAAPHEVARPALRSGHVEAERGGRLGG